MAHRIIIRGSADNQHACQASGCRNQPAQQEFPREFVEKDGTRAKKRNEGGGGRERRKQRFLFSPPPPPPPSIFFFCSRSNYGAITRLGTLATQAIWKWEGGGEEGRGRDLGRGVSVFAFFLLLSISLFAPATEACRYHSSDINIQRPVLLSSSRSDVDFFA